MSVGISLGYNCHSATHGKCTGIRKSKSQGYKTCPFDEMNTNYEGLILCLKEDFKYFCDPAYLIVKKFPSDDPYYPNEYIICNTRYGFIFNHESPGHANLYELEKWSGGIGHFVDNNYEKFIERYRRRIDNFREYISVSNFVTFLITSPERSFNELSDIFHTCSYEIVRYDIPNYASYIHHLKIMNELKQ
jgi:hypothetical protein